MRLAIVGAGLAGLAAANRLRTAWPQLEIVIFEKSRGLGGRAASRRSHGVTFDHGAQYLKTPSPELHAFITELLPHPTLHDIGLPVWTFDGSGQIAPGDPEQNDGDKWSYADGLTRLAKELAVGLDIRRELRVERIATRPAGGYRLLGQNDIELAQAELLLLTPPAPQIVDVLARSELRETRRETLIAELNRATYRRCLSVTLGYQRQPRERPFYALVNIDRLHPISWLAYEHRKPGRAVDEQGVLIAQMAPGWSTEHWEDEQDALATTVADLITELLDEDIGQPHWSDRQGWRYALPDGAADAERLHTDDGLFFAGDYLAGQGRLHLAIESGWSAAARIMELL